MSAEGFFPRVYALVRGIPRGRVVTYGQVAAALGVVHGARAVGWALRALPEEESARVPWHRVVGAGGRISPRAGLGPEIQRRRLRAEGVVFRSGAVDLTRHGLLRAVWASRRRAGDRRLARGAPARCRGSSAGWGTCDRRDVCSLRRNSGDGHARQPKRLSRPLA
jgi:methylated-DNA-protein-cysteine methyltransferase-like protein